MITRHTAVVAGLGHSIVTRRAEEPLGVLAAIAARAAVADAGITLAEVDGVGAVLGGHHGFTPRMRDGRDYVSAELLVRQLDLNSTWGTNSDHMVGNAFVDAVRAVESNACRYALLVRGMHSPSGVYGASFEHEVEGAEQFIAPYGWFTPALFANGWTRYQAKYGSGSREQMATLVVQARAHGRDNPNSYWHGHPELTVESYLASRTVSTPLSVLDCDIPVQGAAAMLITRADLVDADRRVAHVRGVASPEPRLAADGGLLLLEEQEEAAAYVAGQLWADSGLRASHIDTADLYDGFSSTIVQWLEGLGFAGRGEGYEFVQDGRTTLGGELPLNLGGGNLGAGRMHGIPHLFSAARQVMGRAGGMQADHVEFSLATVGPPSLGAAVVLSASQG